MNTIHIIFLIITFYLLARFSIFLPQDFRHIRYFLVIGAIVFILFNFDQNNFFYFQPKMSLSLDSPWDWEPIIGPFYLLFLTRNPFIKLVILFIAMVLFIVVATSMIANCLFLYLDNKYRRTDNQLPYNVIMDRVIPSILLILPSICCIILRPFENWVNNFGILIIIHIFIIIPIFHYWSNLRFWINKSEKLWAWNQPKIFHDIAIASLYPAIWGIYFSSIRYLRIGYSLDYSNLVIYNDWIVILLFMCLVYSIWIKLILWKLVDIKEYLWEHTYLLLHSIHLRLLQNNIYFNLLELFYKLSYIWYSVIITDIIIYGEKSKEKRFFKLLYLLYTHSYLFHLFFLVVILIELILSKGILFYSVYLMFWYPILFFFFHSLNSFSNYPWSFAVDASDYLHGKFKNPRYPVHFWKNFSIDDYRFNFNVTFTVEEQEKLDALAEPYLLKRNIPLYHGKTLGYQVFVTNKPWCMRLKTSYYTLNGIRWVHTGTSFHKASAYFARSPWDKITLLYSSWSHYSVIKAADAGKNNIYPGNCYVHFNFPNTPSFTEFVEYNAVTRFSGVINKGVQVSTFKDQLIDVKNQIRPDLIFNFKYQSKYLEKRTIGMDQKTSTGIGNFALMSHVDESRYMKTIDFFIRELRNKRVLTFQQEVALTKLKSTCSDFEIHVDIWATNLHLFSDKIPPLLLSPNFAIKNLKPEYQEALIICQKRMIKVSDYLITRKTPPTNKDGISEETRKLLNDKIINQIFIDHPLSSIEL